MFNMESFIEVTYCLVFLGIREHVTGHYMMSFQTSGLTLG